MPPISHDQQEAPLNALVELTNTPPDFHFTYKNLHGAFHVDSWKGLAIFKWPYDGEFYSNPLVFSGQGYLNLGGGQTDAGFFYRVPDEAFHLFFSTQPFLNPQTNDLFYRL